MSSSTLTTEQQINSLWAFGGLSKMQLLRRVSGGTRQNDLLNRGYELAYNFLLAVFPLLLVIIALLGVFAAEGSRLQATLFNYLQQFLPPAGYVILVQTLQEITRN